MWWWCLYYRVSFRGSSRASAINLTLLLKLLINKKVQIPSSIKKNKSSRSASPARPRRAERRLALSPYYGKIIDETKKRKRRSEEAKKQKLKISNNEKTPKKNPRSRRSVTLSPFVSFFLRHGDFINFYFTPWRLGAQPAAPRPGRPTLSPEHPRGRWTASA